MMNEKRYAAWMNGEVSPGEVFEESDGEHPDLRAVQQWIRAKSVKAHDEYHSALLADPDHADKRTDALMTRAMILSQLECDVTDDLFARIRDGEMSAQEKFTKWSFKVGGSTS